MKKQHTVKTEGLQADIDNQEHLKKVLIQTNNNLRAENRDLESNNEVLASAITTQVEEKTALSGTISELTQHISETETVLEDLEVEVKQKTDKLTELNNQYEATTIDYERDLEKLEAKKQAIIQESVEIKAAQDQVRDNLASWQKTLEEKEKNLRIREQKADQQEKAIARNYNLLNL